MEYISLFYIKYRELHALHERVKTGEADVEALKKQERVLVSDVRRLKRLADDAADAILNSPPAEKTTSSNLDLLLDAISQQEEQHRPSRSRSTKRYKDTERFLEAEKEKVKQIFTMYRRKYYDERVLPCIPPTGTCRIWTISDEQKRIHKMCAGIIGTPSRRGKQNFNVYLNNVLLSSKKVGFEDTELTSFTDPRDASAVIELLQKAFGEFREKEREESINKRARVEEE